MPVKITSKRNGFRRCGIEHPDKTVVYPDGKFTPEQLKQLKAEPMLIVEEISAEKPSVNSVPSNNPLDGMNVDTALQTINSLSLTELQQVLDNEKRVTITRAAQAKIDELNQQTKQPDGNPGQ